MSLTELLDNVEVIKDWVIPIYRDGQWTTVELNKYFYDISVYLSIHRIQDLLKMGNGVHILKDRKGITFTLDFDMLNKLYKITRDERWNLFQWGKMIPMPKPEIVINPGRESSAKKAEPKVDNSAFSELEKAVIKQWNTILSKEDVVNIVHEVIKDLKSKK